MHPLDLRFTAFFCLVSATTQAPLSLGIDHFLSFSGWLQRGKVSTTTQAPYRIVSTHFQWSFFDRVNTKRSGRYPQLRRPRFRSVLTHLIFFSVGQYQAKRDVSATTQAPLSLTIDPFVFFSVGQYQAKRDVSATMQAPPSLSIDPFLSVLTI